MRLLRRRKSKPVAVALWSVAPKLRALRPGEALEAGAVIHLDGDMEPGRVWRFHDWMYCGRTRYARLKCSAPQCPDLHVADDTRLRIVDEGAQAKRKGRR